IHFINSILTIHLHDALPIFSIPNRLSTISVLMLINRYSETMINSMKKNNYFSVRVPHKHSSLLYKKSNKSTVKYETEEEKSQIRSEEHTSELQSRFYIVCCL